MNYIDDSSSSTTATTTPATAKLLPAKQSDVVAEYIVTKLDDVDDPDLQISQLVSEQHRIDKEKLTRNQNYDKPKSKKSKSSAAAAAAASKSSASSKHKSTKIDLIDSAIETAFSEAADKKQQQQQQYYHHQQRDQIYDMVKDMINFKWPPLNESDFAMPDNDVNQEQVYDQASANLTAASNLINTTSNLTNNNSSNKNQVFTSEELGTQRPSRIGGGGDKAYLSKTRSPSNVRKSRHKDQTGVATVRFRSVSRTYGKEKDIDGRNSGRFGMSTSSASASRNPSRSSSVKVTR